MEIRKILKNTAPLVFIVITAVLSRLIPHPPNFAPITGIALFSGARLTGAKRFIIPIAIMILSDIFLGFHATIPYVYGSFIIISLLGSIFLKKRNAPTILMVSFGSSLLFYLITNFGAWLNLDMYDKSFSGLMSAYIMGLPFLRNAILGDLFYSLGLFYGYQYLIFSYGHLHKNRG